MPNMTTAFFSGFMPSNASVGTTANLLTYTIRVMDTKPVWFYCSQGMHCQAGMVGAINAYVHIPPSPIQDGHANNSAVLPPVTRPLPPTRPSPLLPRRTSALDKSLDKETPLPRVAPAPPRLLRQEPVLEVLALELPLPSLLAPTLLSRPPTPHLVSTTLLGNLSSALPWVVWLLSWCCRRPCGMERIIFKKGPGPGVRCISVIPFCW